MTEATEAKWADRVREWKSSGESADEYAARLGVKPGTLRWWSSRLRRRVKADGGVASEPSVRIVRVVAKEKSAAGTLMVRVGTAQVEVRAGFDRSLLRELVEALGGEP
jgi:transposase